MAEYIDREKVLALGYWHGEHPDFDNPNPDGVDAVDVSNIEAMPAADVAEVVHGRWNVVEGCRLDNAICSNCGRNFQAYYEAYRFCPNCGAKMDGAAE